jgi:hypothetical protein
MTGFLQGIEDFVDCVAIDMGVNCLVPFKQE